MNIREKYAALRRQFPEGTTTHTAYTSVLIALDNTRTLEEAREMIKQQQPGSTDSAEIFEQFLNETEGE